LQAGTMRSLCIIRGCRHADGLISHLDFMPSNRNHLFRPWPEHLSARAAASTLLLASLAITAGCTSSDPSRTGILQPYRIDLPQGNYLTQDMVERVRPGMTPEQVRDLLGSPLLGHVFHADRWDYVFRYRHPNGQAEQRRVTVLFRDGRVADMRADALPAREDPKDPALPGFRQPPVKPRS
jgi:outer membrane protein assembly factor BamE